MTASPALRTAIDWGTLAPLRLVARNISDGVYAGAHRSAKRGAGVEFGGHREYTLGDDLRWLDRRALLRYERLIVRQFETETDRAVWVVVDATASMAYRGSRARGAKLAYAAVIGAALTKIALSTGDPVALTYLGGNARTRGVARSSGREQFERVVASLELAGPDGDALKEPAALWSNLDLVARLARRGSVIVVISDALDFPDGTLERMLALGSQGRSLAFVQLMDPDELEFPFEGTMRLRAMEGAYVVETDAAAVKQDYLNAVNELSARIETTIIARGGRYLRADSSQEPGHVVRRVVELVR